MLVEFYPDNAAAVMKYIRLAGYAREEESLLLDRAVGRMKKTEYLYQGRVGRKHDKRLEERLKQAAKETADRAKSSS